MAKHGKIQTFLEYGAARSILAIVTWLPTNLAMNFGRGLGRLGYLLAGDLRRTADTNLKLAFPEKTDEERQAMIRGCFASLGRQLGIFGKFSNGSGKGLLSMMQVEGLEHIETAVKADKGVVVYTAHLGAWELTSYGVSLLGYPFTFIARPIENEKIETLIERRRTSFGNSSLDKFSAARSMVRILRSGQMLGLLVDLNTLDDEGLFVDFFGVPASTNFIMPKIAVRLGLPVLPVFAPWDEKLKKYRLIINPPLPMESTGNQDDDVRRLTEAVTNAVEQHVRQYPEQWLWVHKRWKTRPPGEPSIY